MHQSPNTWPQESFTGFSASSSPGNPWSKAATVLVFPLGVTYSNLQIEHSNSSFSSVLISTRGKDWIKLSTVYSPPFPIWEKNVESTSIEFCISSNSSEIGRLLAARRSRYWVPTRSADAEVPWGASPWPAARRSRYRSPNRSVAVEVPWGASPWPAARRSRYRIPTRSVDVEVPWKSGSSNWPSLCIWIMWMCGPEGFFDIHVNGFFLKMI